MQNEKLNEALGRYAASVAAVKDLQLKLKQAEGQKDLDFKGLERVVGPEAVREALARDDRLDPEEASVHAIEIADGQLKISVGFVSEDDVRPWKYEEVYVPLDGVAPKSASKPRP